ncbi:MAG: hypothetical protein BWZ08_00410 [candidate division BRC1 bacterium ADurb.BinA292]|nr:MAG: hypothetical protein BWZ08_00410 [candidate division BRC1 bacterium ADurb.BinA292]
MPCYHLFAQRIRHAAKRFASSRRTAAFVALMLSLLLTSGGPTPAAQTLGFGSPGPLNSNAASDSGSDLVPVIASGGSGIWIAVWQSDDSLGGTLGADSDILYARSTDNGVSWTAPAALNSNAASDSGSDEDCAIAGDGNGNLIVVWTSLDSLGSTIGTDEDILFSRSSDNGANWTAPAAIASYAPSDSDFDNKPAIATDGAGRWVVLWQSSNSLGGAIGVDLDILYVRSTDNGANWSAPAAFNSNAASDSGQDYYVTLTADGQGLWIGAWTSTDSLGNTTSFDPDLLFTRSIDDGANWSAPQALNSNAGSDSGDDYRAALAADGAGNWLVAWVSTDSLGGTLGTDQDILFSRSSNDGTSWTSPAPVHDNADSDSTALDERPSLAVDADGNWLVCWQSTANLGGALGNDFDLLVSQSTDLGASWTAPAALADNADTDIGADEAPTILAHPDGTWLVVWNSADYLGSTIGLDNDILVSSSMSVPIRFRRLTVD